MCWSRVWLVNFASSFQLLYLFQRSFPHCVSGQHSPQWKQELRKNDKNVKRSPEESDLINMFNKRTKIHWGKKYKLIFYACKSMHIKLLYTYIYTYVHFTSENFYKYFHKDISANLNMNVTSSYKNKIFNFYLAAVVIC